MKQLVYCSYYIDSKQKCNLDLDLMFKRTEQKDSNFPNIKHQLKLGFNFLYKMKPLSNYSLSRIGIENQIVVESSYT